MLPPVASTILKINLKTKNRVAENKATLISNDVILQKPIIDKTIRKMMMYVLIPLAFENTQSSI